MTEVIVNECNSSRYIVPTFVRDEGLDVTNVEIFYGIYRFLFYLLVWILIVIRHVAPTALICYALWKLWDVHVRSQRDATCQLPLPPGDCGFPFVGETLQMIFSDRSFFRKKRKLYGDIFRTHILGQPTIRVVGSEHVKHVLRGENILVATYWPESTRTLLGEGSLSHASGQNHILRKRAIMKSFSFDALARYVPVIQEVTHKYVCKWIAQGRVLGYPEFKILNFDLTCRLLLGIQMEEEECARLLKTFDVFISNIFCLPVDVYGSGYRKGKRARDVLLKKIDEVIQEKLASNDFSDGSDVLSMMHQMGEDDNLSIDEIKNVFIEILFAGHGTTSSAEAYLVYILVTHPEVRSKMKAEMMAHGLLRAKGADDKERPQLTLQQLNKLTYFNNVVKEVLRVSPPVGGGFRKALKTFEIGGYQIPKGWSVIYGIKDTHETDGYFANAESFDPDRWNTPCASQSQFKYLPFGGGRRACAGKDLARIMQKIFAFELVQDCHLMLENPDTRFSTFPVPSPKDDLPLIVTKRV